MCNKSPASPLYSSYQYAICTVFHPFYYTHVFMDNTHNYTNEVAPRLL